MRRSLLLVASLGCAGPRPAAVPGLCGVAAVDTTGWREVTSRYGTFALRLPPDATEQPAQCTDSACGHIAIGGWVLTYDSGPMAGPGDSVPPWEGEIDVRRCPLQVGERSGEVMTARYATDPREAAFPRAARDSSWVGHVVARAGVPLAPSVGGLYLGMHSVHGIDQAVFMTALRTLRILDPMGAFPGRGPPP